MSAIESGKEREYVPYEPTSQAQGVVTSIPETRGYGTKIRPIHITQVDNGYFVKVGCKSFVFETYSSLLDNLKDYCKNPGQWEDRFNPITDKR